MTGDALLPGLEEEAAKLLEAIKRRSSFLLTSHVSLDGDGICSELALSRVLQKMGKKAWIVNESEVPHVYSNLAGIEKVMLWPKVPKETRDAVVLLDIGKWSRMGKLQEVISLSSDFIIDIDHHLSNTGCGHVNMIDPNVSSTGELMFEFFKWARLPIDPQVALLLYVAISTDTGRFSFDNTSTRTHRNAAQLMEYGIRPQEVSNMVYRRQTLAQMELYRKALESLTLTPDGQIAWIILRRRDFEETGTSALLTQDFIETPRSMEGVKIGIYFRETRQPGKTKVSLRANVPIDLNQFSSAYNGGGHAAAAGISMNATIEQAIATIVPALKMELDQL